MPIILNIQQQKAVEADGVVIVKAGPGTGKTELLTSRIVHNIQKQFVDPENILCLTYTDAGASEMKQRLNLKIGVLANKISIFTFHSFSKYIIDQEIYNTYFPTQSFEILDDLNRKKILRSIIEKLPSDSVIKKNINLDFNSSIKKTENYINFFTNENIVESFLNESIDTWIEMIQVDPDLGFIYKKKSGESKKGDLNVKLFNTELETCKNIKTYYDIYKKYESEKLKLKYHDFDDILKTMLEVLKNEPNFRSEIQEKYQYILIDEYQDTSGLQLAIAELIFDNENLEYPNLFIVGDEDQTIYEFQGAKVGNFKRIIDKYKHLSEDQLHVIDLIENRRSTQKIINLYDKLIRNNISEIERVKLIAKNEKIANLSNLPKLIVYQNDIEAVSDLIQKIEKIVNNSEETVGVLYKNNKQIDLLQRCLQEKKINFSTKKSINILGNNMILSLIQILNWCKTSTNLELWKNDDKIEYIKWNLNSEYLFFEMIKNEIFNLDLQQIYSLAAIKKSDKSKSLFEIFNNSNDEKIKSILRKLENIVKIYNKGTLAKTVKCIISEFEILDKLKNSDNKFLNIASYNTLIDYLTENNQRYISNTEFLNDINTMIDEKIPLPYVAIFDKNAKVILSTIHGSKGLQFDHVYIIGLDESEWKNKNKLYVPITLGTYGSVETQLQSDRRLFFVGLSRAKIDLEVSYIKTKKTGTDSKPLQLIYELIDIDKSTDYVYQNEIQEVTIDNDILYKTTETNLSDEFNFEKYSNDILIKSQLMNFSWSASALYEYITNEKKWFENRILNIKSDGNVNITKGNVIHKFYELIGKNPDMKNDKLSLFELYKNIIDNAKDSLEQFEYLDIIQEFDNFLNKYNIIFDEKNYEKVEFEKIFNSNIDNIEINGKIDRLEYNGKTVKLFDYKTGKYNRSHFANPQKESITVDSLMSLAENERAKILGDHWLQMGFYRLLIENNNLTWGDGIYTYLGDKEINKYDIDISTQDIEYIQELLHKCNDKLKLS